MASIPDISSEACAPGDSCCTVCQPDESCAEDNEDEAEGSRATEGATGPGVASRDRDVKQASQFKKLDWFTSVHMWHSHALEGIRCGCTSVGLRCTVPVTVMSNGSGSKRMAVPTGSLSRAPSRSCATQPMARAPFSIEGRLVRRCASAISAPGYTRRNSSHGLMYTRSRIVELCPTTVPPKVLMLSHTPTFSAQQRVLVGHAATSAGRGP